jgi:hypothetical protein
VHSYKGCLSDNSDSIGTSAFGGGTELMTMK